MNLVHTKIHFITFFITISSFGQRQNQIDTTINQFMKHWNIPGVSIAIVNKGKLVYTKGYGFSNMSTQEKVTPTHRFRIASVSKPITSVIIFKLIEEQKLKLNTKIFGKKGILNDSIYSDILDKRILKITLQQLLEHTAGWNRDISFDPMFQSKHIANHFQYKKSPNSSDIIRYMLQTQYLDFEPGDKYAYSNFGYCILGRVIEKITGTTYETYAQQVLLKPLGMYDTYIGNSKTSQHKESKYYLNNKNIDYAAFYPFRKTRKIQYGGFNLKAMDSHGGWVSSSIDLAKFICAVDGYNNRPDILSKKSQQTMTTQSHKTTYYAKGWAVNSSGNWWHMGSLPGTSSMIARIHDGKGWVILMNKRVTSDFSKFRRDIDQLIWKAIRGINLSQFPNQFDKY